MNAIKIALLTTAMVATTANARDFGNGFSLTGEVELEYINGDGDDETIGFTDLTLSWRSQGSGAVGFGFDLSFVDWRLLSDGDYINDLWAAVVLTTSYGEFAVGKPRPILDRMFITPDFGGTGYFDLLTGYFGGVDGSFLAKITMFDDVNSYGATFQGASGGLSYGAGLHRYESGGEGADGFEIGGTYTMGQTEVFAGFERFSVPGMSVDRSRLGLRYSADRWSIGAHMSRFDAGSETITSAMLFGDYQVTDAFKVGAQFLNLSLGPDDQDFYGLSAEYGFAGGGFTQLGVLSLDGSEELYSASVGFRF